MGIDFPKEIAPMLFAAALVILVLLPIGIISYILSSFTKQSDRHLKYEKVVKICFKLGLILLLATAFLAIVWTLL